MKKGILILIYFCCFTGLCLGQNKDVDSLLQVLRTAKADTAQVNTLNVLADEFRNNNPDTAIYFANQAQALAIKSNYKMGITVAQLTMSTANINLGKYDEALKNSNNALKLCDQLLPIAIGTEKIGGKSIILKQKSSAYNSIGRIYSYQGNYPEGLKNFFLSLKISDKNEHKSNNIRRQHQSQAWAYYINQRQ